MPTAHPGLFSGASPAGLDAFEDDPVDAAPGLEVDGLAERPSFLPGGLLLHELIPIFHRQGHGQYSPSHHFPATTKFMNFV